MKVQRIFFAYRYYHVIAEENTHISKWYMEKAANLAGNGLSPD